MIVAALWALWTAAASSFEALPWGVWPILGLALTGSTIAVVGAAVALKRYIARTPKLAASAAQHAVVSDSAHTVGQQAESGADVKPPVEFLVEGNWLNTPFQKGDGPEGLGVHYEDVYLTLEANEFLEHVRVEMIACEEYGKRPTHVRWHKGTFEGAVPAGMKEAIRVFRRRFDFERIAIRNANGGHTHTQRRSMKEVVLFDGTPSEVRTNAPAISFEIRVHRKRAHGDIEKVAFVVTVDDALAPQSRLFANGGPLQIRADPMARPFGAAMIYEDIATDISSSKDAASVEQYPRQVVAKVKPEPDTWYLDAIFYCVHKRWLGEAEQALNQPGQLDEAADFLTVFRQHARNGNIVVWGKIWENSTWDPIPADYWAHHWVEPTELMREKPERLVSDAATPEGKNGPFYKYLKVSRSQIEEHCPPRERYEPQRSA